MGRPYSSLLYPNTMAQRTTLQKVREILADNYDGKTGLQQFIDSATVLIDRVATCAAAKSKTLTAGELEILERWASAHLYAQSDLLRQSESANGASASYQGQTGMHFESTRYGQTALNLDYSGCLTVITKRQVAGMFWAGNKVPPTLLEDGPQ